MVAKLDSTSRLAKLTPAVLSTAANPVLDKAVTDARTLAQTSSSIITLVAKNVQFFRASTGLPADLEVSRATSRCDSFCQFVVKSEGAFVVFDSLEDMRVPRRLVDAYGIRAYCGVPVRIENEVVGSLCVFDDKPRDFDGRVVDGLSSIADVVSDELWREWRGHIGTSTDGQLTTESGALLRLANAKADGTLAANLVERGRLALDELEGALKKAVLAAPESIRIHILAFLDTMPEASRSFALAKLVLMTNFPSSTADEATLRDVVRSAIAKLGRD